MNRHLDRGQILKLFDELSAELRQQGARAQVYIVGGAAMSLAFSRDRRTEDVDGRIDKGHSRLTDAVRTVGRRHDLPETWLNDQATSMMPGERDARASTLYESAYLTVTGASARHLLGMKLASARDKDDEDIAVLCKHLGLEGPEDAIRIFRELFPEEHLKSRARTILAEVFRERSVEYER